MPLYSFETALPVDCYIDDEDPEADADDAFEDARDDDDLALEASMEDVAEYIGEEDTKKLIFKHAVFLEFDSTNPHHAAAYFQVTVEGPQEVIDKLDAAIDAEGE